MLQQSAVKPELQQLPQGIQALLNNEPAVVLTAAACTFVAVGIYCLFKYIVEDIIYVPINVPATGIPPMEEYRGFEYIAIAPRNTPADINFHMHESMISVIDFGDNTIRLYLPLNNTPNIGNMLNAV